MQISFNIAQDYTADKFLMRTWSFFSLFVERAMAIETATGRPSGIATIRTHKARMQILAD